MMNKAEGHSPGIPVLIVADDASAVAAWCRRSLSSRTSTSLLRLEVVALARNWRPSYGACDADELHAADL